MVVFILAAELGIEFPFREHPALIGAVVHRDRERGVRAHGDMRPLIRRRIVHAGAFDADTADTVARDDELAVNVSKVRVARHRRFTFRQQHDIVAIRQLHRRSGGSCCGRSRGGRGGRGSRGRGGGSRSRRGSRGRGGFVQNRRQKLTRIRRRDITVSVRIGEQQLLFRQRTVTHDMLNDHSDIRRRQHTVSVDITAHGCRAACLGSFSSDHRIRGDHHRNQRRDEHGNRQYRRQHTLTVPKHHSIRPFSLLRFFRSITHKKPTVQEKLLARQAFLT